MENCLSINEIVKQLSTKEDCTFEGIPNKEIMFVATKSNGVTITLLTPWSKLYKPGFHWVEITQKQYDLMDETDEALIIFRLDSRRPVTVQWSEFKKYLRSECLQFTTNREDHWKMNIYDDYIKIRGNQNVYRIN